MTSQLKTTGKYTRKRYKCTGCDTIKNQGTNHWGKIYPHCYTCNRVTVWECLEPIPEGYTTPPEWRIVRLGDILK